MQAGGQEVQVRRWPPTWVAQHWREGTATVYPDPRGLPVCFRGQRGLGGPFQRPGCRPLTLNTRDELTGRELGLSPAPCFKGHPQAPAKGELYPSRKNQVAPPESTAPLLQLPPSGLGLWRGAAFLSLFNSVTWWPAWHNCILERELWNQGPCVEF